VAIGEVSPRHRRLMATTYETMMVGIQAAAAGRRIGDIGYAMQLYAETRGYGIVADYTGHGLGRRMHEDPTVPSVGRPGTGPVIPEGLVITIEPILVEHSPGVAVDPDGWAVRTRDGGWAAQFEHTVVVTRRGATILSTLDAA
jgi:methionyl aminopeptidase